MAAAGGRRKNVSSITVQEFIERHGEDLGLSVEHPVVGLERLIKEPAVNRPGLALSGFFTYFANKRIQVFGNSEVSYLKKLDPEVRLERFTQLCDQAVPCVVIARGHQLEKSLMAVAQEKQVAVIRTEQPTMKFLNEATIRLERDFAPRTTLHGCMVDYRGIGILIMGLSGSGKSETAIGLLEKGAALVADDVVYISQKAGELLTRSKDFARGYLEMRGIGVINVANLYGLSAIRPEKKLDLVVELKPETDLNKVDRLGLEQKQYRILDTDVPFVEIPVAPGRDTARLVGVAALDLQLRRVGFNMADEFNRRLLEEMTPNFDA
ncbi:HPr(Ser) kinase/phosphatase [Akkermansiaceae bacterium]|nr:HPr(Ser) kinase/phosphatase [Akkermansiaceae bacterium]MDB4272408.1 HPr(Ser) kinase/phosphatase [bacterium]MDA7864234.1 HPr(Ser) kinase/phosphatase [Akkermansiaceae bacterium]MDA8967074.1 HPr(Ser) kinase/phosphatase [Akkermansiaceae bacterium]MDB0056450.1 HPr(Ser) kinase/phosphatase [Akkermansiaceae bacterium]